MTLEQIIEAAELYKKALKKSNPNVQAIRCDTAEKLCGSISEHRVLMERHLYWMCFEICRLAEEEAKREKTMCWVCFIQGTLWSFGLLSIDEFKDHNR